MVAHFNMRTYGVNQTFLCYIERVVKAQEKNRKRPISHHTCATCSKLPPYISTMGNPGKGRRYNEMSGWDQIMVLLLDVNSEKGEITVI